MGRKTTEENKKTVVSATGRGKKLLVKKKPRAINPFGNIDVSKIAMLGERRDNVKEIKKKDFDFQLEKHLPKILKKYPNHNVGIYGGSPQLSLDRESAIPCLVGIVVPKPKLPPQFVAVSRKGGIEITSFEKHKLQWEKKASGVYILTSKKRMTNASIQALTEDARNEEEHLQLWTIDPTEKLERKNNGDYKIKFANFEVYNDDGTLVINDEYQIGQGFEEYVDGLVEDYGTELGENAREMITFAIKTAFKNARTELEEQVDLLQKCGFPEDMLSEIKSVKIYPKNVDQAAKVNYINRHYLRADEVY